MTRSSATPMRSASPVAAGLRVGDPGQAQWWQWQRVRFMPMCMAVARLVLVQCLLVLGLLFVLMLAARAAQAQTRTQAQTAPAGIPSRPVAARAPVRGEAVTLNFVNAEIESVVRAVGQFLRRDILVDPRVKGTITLVTDQPVGRDEAWRQLLAALRFQGFAVVESGGFARVVPEADAKFFGGPTVIGGPTAAPVSEQLVTQIFRLNYESANALLPMLRPLVSANNPISANASNNTLVITDYAENLRRIGRIIAAVDSPAGEAPDVVPLRHALAIDLAGVVARLLDPAPGAATDPGQRIVVLAEPRTNSLLLRGASPARMNYARSLIARLDSPTSVAGNIHIVHLKNADAARLAQTLRAVISGDTSQPPPAQTGGSTLAAAATASMSGNGAAATSRPSGATGSVGFGGAPPGTSFTTGAAGTSVPGGSPFSAGNLTGAGIVQADVATNSLIITAPEPVYRNLRAVIESLDTRRAQVFVESLIVEVTSDKAAEFGVQWQDLAGVNGGNRQLIGGTNFGGVGRNIISGSQNLGTLATGLNIGIVRGTITIPGLGAITNLNFLARALESDANANILSTPNLLMLDNEEAQIVVGQNVPFITGQYAQTGTTTTVTPFQTIERRDVGLTLRVRSQISEGGTVKLQIYQEVSSVQDTSVAAGVVTNKRSIESSVLVEDGQIIVLGGLVQDTVNEGRDKVPLIGDLPIIGNLFRYDTRRRGKTNLMVFLRPYVLRGPELNNVTVDRYDRMRAEQQRVQPQPSWILPDIKAPVLPPLPLVPAPAPPVPASPVPAPYAPVPQAPLPQAPVPQAPTS